MDVRIRSTGLYFIWAAIALVSALAWVRFGPLTAALYALLVWEIARKTMSWNMAKRVIVIFMMIEVFNAILTGLGVPLPMVWATLPLVLFALFMPRA